MKTTRIVFMTLIMLAFASEMLKAQYEQKFTLQISSGASFIVSDYNFFEKKDFGSFFNSSTQSWQTYSNNITITESMFSPGFMFNAGLQYNFSRKFSIVGLLMAGSYYYNDDEIYYNYLIEGPFLHPNLQVNKLQKVNYYNLGIGVSAKYKFFHTRKFRPYLLYGMSVCYIDGTVLFERMEAWGYQLTMLGLNAAIGLEYDVSDNVTLFLQPGFNKVLPREDDGQMPTESVYALFGVNLNMFKSKSL
jgi:opacity protein-like surface antigen